MDHNGTNLETYGQVIAVGITRFAIKSCCCQTQPDEIIETDPDVDVEGELLYFDFQFHNAKNFFPFWNLNKILNY